MNYEKIYSELISKARIRQQVQDEYYERHHVVPRCIDGSKANVDVVLLTAREHFIAHALLVQIYKHQDRDQFRKLLYAFRYMTVHNTKRRANNRDYAWSRKLFSTHHPMHNLNARKRMRSSLLNYYKSDAAVAKISSAMKLAWKAGKFDQLKANYTHIIKTCQCGCGKTFTVKITQKSSNQLRRKYITGHQSYGRWHNCSSDIQASRREKQRNYVKDQISKLTPEELKARMKNSVGSADHIARGRAISLAKKGKSTNQREIQIVKYGMMTDAEFAEFIKNRTVSVRGRMLNQRNEYARRISAS